ncbi:zinc finger BED domain-containing protein RICESLEEPER 2-like [Canna indica]|uniref:Zinc finger BED domain-containing protein RICESLEEPER 2-like n=1 Tax=Canna indica TaxID=4628 RepID=A0AAQ3L504_9LILI|nr:zinc finger BED domain-containing protein RICESLEEPER 2-like [Canna indica]
MEKCKKRDTRDVGQMLLSSNAQGNMTLSDCSFDPNKFRELVASAIAMHNLPFQFVEYRGIRACFEYLRPSVQQVSRNTAKVDILKLYELEKKKIKNVLARRMKRIVLNGDLFHLRCCAHILNLIVQEGLKNVDIVVEKVRDSVKYVRGSQSRKEKFLECVKSLCLDGKQGLRQDVPTRWNSTFLMLKSALYYKTAFEHLTMSDSSYTNCPSMWEWSKVEKLCTFLGIYYNLTCLFSGTKYPTSNLFSPLVVKIYHNLRMECTSEDEPMRRMATRMMGKFEKYWSNFNET